MTYIWSFNNYVYDFIIKMFIKHAEVVQNHDNVNVRNIGKGEPKTHGAQTWWRSRVGLFKCLNCHNNIRFSDSCCTVSGHAQTYIDIII